MGACHHGHHRRYRHHRHRQKYYLVSALGPAVGVHDRTLLLFLCRNRVDAACGIRTQVLADDSPHAPTLEGVVQMNGCRTLFPGPRLGWAGGVGEDLGRMSAQSQRTRRYMLGGNKQAREETFHRRVPCYCGRNCSELKSNRWISRALKASGKFPFSLPLANLPHVLVGASWNLKEFGTLAHTPASWLRVSGSPSCDVWNARCPLALGPGGRPQPHPTPPAPKAVFSVVLHPSAQETLSNHVLHRTNALTLLSF